MHTRLALWSAAAAIPIYVVACAMPDGGLFRAARFRDVHLYEGFANSVFDGRVPYRDFFMEYPPGALAVFLPPAAAGDHYNAAFKALMALCGGATLVLVALLLARLNVSAQRLWTAVLLVAVSPIALGPISLNTYDAWPALLTVAALALLLDARPVAAFALLGLAFAAKVYPLVLLPPALIYIWRTSGRSRAVRASGAFTGVAALVVLPFLAVAPHGLLESFRAQAARALQDESLGASFLEVADRLGWYSATIVHRSGEAISNDLSGSLPRALAAASSAAQLIAVLLVAWLYLRGRDDARRLAIACAAVVSGFLAFTRFFSPQYLVWLIPFAALTGAAVWALTAAALVLAQLWFFHYHDVHAVGGYVWLVFARNLLVVALFVVTLLALRRRSTKDEDAIPLEDESPVRVPA